MTNHLNGVNEMLIPLALAAVVVAGVVWQKYADPYAAAPVIVTIFASVFLAVVLLTVPIGRLDTRSQILEFNSLRTTLEAARTRDPNSIENAAFQVKIADANQWLARKQYWNGTAFDIWIPDAVESLRPIQ